MQCSLLREHKKSNGLQPHKLIKEEAFLSSPLYQGETCGSERFKGFPKVTEKWHAKTSSLDLELPFLTTSVHSIIWLMWANASSPHRYLPSRLGLIKSIPLVNSTSRRIWVFPRPWSDSELPHFLRESQLVRAREQKRNKRTPFRLYQYRSLRPNSDSFSTRRNRDDTQGPQIICQRTRWRDLNTCCQHLSYFWFRLNVTSDQELLKSRNRYRICESLISDIVHFRFSDHSWPVVT